MFFRLKFALIAGLIGGSGLFAVKADAQTRPSGYVESSPLGQLDPWGFGYLSRSEPSLSQSAWQASLSEDLLPIMQATRTQNLTPTERALLRRIVLSQARAPAGSRQDDLLAERARLMFELGEARSAAALMERLTRAPEGIVPDQLAVDLQFALGQVASACRKVQDASRVGAFWMKMRAVCFSLEGNQPGAELAIELARSSGVNDPWLFSAVEASFLTDGPRPSARFDTGYALTLSVYSDLPVPINSVGYSKPHLAAAMAIRPALPAELRVQAAGVAAEAGLISIDDHLATYDALFAEEDFRPNSPLEVAMATLSQPGSSTSDRARQIASALQSARGSAARFNAISRLMAPAIDALPISDQTMRYGRTFSAAMLAAENPRGAYQWAVRFANRSLQDGATGGDRFESLWLMGLSIVGGLDSDETDIAAWADEIILSAGQSSRKQAVTRLFGLMTASGVALPPGARRYLATQQQGQQMSPERFGDLNASLAAFEAGATGEGILYLLKLTDGDPSGLTGMELSLLLSAMRDAGVEDLAGDLALEATGFWKTTPTTR